jgi:hypothetical protein
VLDLHLHLSVATAGTNCFGAEDVRSEWKSFDFDFSTGSQQHCEVLQVAIRTLRAMSVDLHVNYVLRSFCLGHVGWGRDFFGVDECFH